MGANLELEDPYVEPEPYEPPDESRPEYPSYGNPTRPGVGCSWNGLPLPCPDIIEMLNEAPGGMFDVLETAARTQSYRRVYTGKNIDVYQNSGLSYDEATDAWRINTTLVGSIPLYSLQPTALSLTPSLLSLLNLRGGGETPQDTSNLKDLDYLISGARDVIANASGDCAKLLGKDALAKFDKIAKNIEFNGDIPVRDYHPFYGWKSGRLADVPTVSAVTDIVTKQIYLNPNGNAFSSYSNTPRSQKALDDMLKKFGASSQRDLAFALIIHEFLHTTGKFKSDSKIGLDGKIDSTKSERYTREVIKKCFPNE